MPLKGNPRENEPRFRRDEDISRLPDGPVDEDTDEVEEESTGGLADLMRQIKRINRNPMLVAGLAAVGVVFLLLLLGWRLGWFGGGADKASRPIATQAADLPQSPETAPQPAQPAAPPAGPPKPVQPQVQPESAEKEKPPEEEPLSDDVTKWKRQDYFRARRENHPKLLEAVVQLGERFRGSAPAAEGLTELLKPLPPEKPAETEAKPAPQAAPLVPGQPGMPPNMPVPGPGLQRPDQKSPALRPPNPQETAKLVEAIVMALGANGSPPARKTLEGILAGTFTTDDDKVAVETAFRALVVNQNAEYDKLLLRLLVEPEKLRPADREGPWPAKQLREKTFELIKQGASFELRVQLAESMADRLIRLTATDPIRDFILAPDAMNCGAQVLLYAHSGGTKEIKARLEQQLLGYSSSALGQLLEITAEPQPSGTHPPAMVAPGLRPMPGISPATASSPSAKPVQTAPLVAGLLWSDKFTAVLDSQLEEARSWEKQPQLLLLAGTIPRDTIRAALAKLARKYWNDGPKSLEAAGFPDRLITDPALVVLLKMFPRKEAKTAKNQPSGTSRSRRTGTTPQSGKLAEAQKAAQKKEQAEQDWMNVSSKLVMAWCKRCHEAALAREKAAVESGNPIKPSQPKLPADYELSPQAVVIASHQIDWPDNASATVADLKPDRLQMYYIRVEETGKPKKVSGYYARQVQARAADIRSLDAKTTWIDSLRTDTKENLRRSVDVLITRADGGAAGAADKDDEDADLIVEFLVIEINDPTARD